MQETLLRIIEAAAARGLQFLLIGGNAVILLGVVRNTLDIDLLVRDSDRSRWLDLLRDLKFRLYYGTDAFAQFEPSGERQVSVDLMFVDPNTWTKLATEPRIAILAGVEIPLPKPEHMVALKLHAASSPNRSTPETDWADIRRLTLQHKLDPADAGFRSIIIRYGGESALRRIESFSE